MQWGASAHLQMSKLSLPAERPLAQVHKKLQGLGAARSKAYLPHPPDEVRSRGEPQGSQRLPESPTSLPRTGSELGWGQAPGLSLGTRFQSPPSTLTPSTARAPLSAPLPPSPPPRTLPAPAQLAREGGQVQVQSGGRRALSQLGRLCQGPLLPAPSLAGGRTPLVPAWH